MAREARDADLNATAVSTLLLLSPLLFYALVDYFFRLTNALMAPELITQFALSADEIGFLTGVFFVGFGLMQFPLGIALDRYGPRPVLLTQLAVATLGALVCFVAEGMWSMSLGRGLMGAGMAGSFMATLKAASLWLPPRQMVSVPGLVVAMTGLGGMLGSGPLAEIRGLDWGSMNLILAALGLAAFVWIAASVPRCRVDQLSRDPLWEQIKQSLGLYRRLDFWRFAPIAMTCTSAIVAYQTLWMTVWLGDVGELGERAIAWSLFGALACLALGGFCVSALTGWMERRGIGLLRVVYGGAGISIVSQLVLAAGYGRFSIPLWFLMAFLYSATVAVYSIVARGYPSQLAARASANMNLLAFLGTFVIQWSFGGLVSHYDPAPDDGYSVFAFRNAMVAIAFVQVAALVWCACIGRGGDKP